MKNDLIEIGVYGCDGYYLVAHLMVYGSVEAETIFAGFYHNKITRKEGKYISAYGYEDDVAEALKKYFIDNVCVELKFKTYEIGD